MNAQLAAAVLKVRKAAREYDQSYSGHDTYHVALEVLASVVMSQHNTLTDESLQAIVDGKPARAYCVYCGERLKVDVRVCPVCEQEVV